MACLTGAEVQRKFERVARKLFPDSDFDAAVDAMVLYVDFITQLDNAGPSLQAALEAVRQHTSTQNTCALLAAIEDHSLNSGMLEAFAASAPDPRRLGAIRERSFISAAMLSEHLSKMVTAETVRAVRRAVDALNNAAVVRDVTTLLRR